MMIKLNKKHQQRWDAAQKLFQSLKDTAIANNAKIMYDGDSLVSVEDIVICDGTIFVNIPTENKNTMRVIWFQADPDWDHGVYTPIKEFAKEVHERFQLCKLIPF